MNDDHEPIERDFSAAELKSKTIWRLIVTTVIAFVLLWYGTSHAQTITAPTRVSSYDWACLDASGAILSSHQRFDTAFVACYNNAAGAEIAGGRYRINKPTAPPVEPPACPPKPADETQTAQCPTGSTGSWTQTQSYGSVAYPTCWVASGFIPSTAPEGACTAIPPPPPELTAPTLAAPTISPNAADPTRSNIALAWNAVTGASGYEVRRCTGVNCTGYTLLATVAGIAYTNTSVPGGFTYKFKVRAIDTATARVGPDSNIVTAVTPTAPIAGTGTATLQWEAPTLNTDGSALTNLAGFRVVFGTTAAALTQSVLVSNAALSTYIVDSLASGTWYFAVRAVTSAGAESADSNVVSKVIP